MTSRKTEVVDGITVVGGRGDVFFYRDGKSIGAVFMGRDKPGFAFREPGFHLTLVGCGIFFDDAGEPVTYTGSHSRYAGWKRRHRASVRFPRDRRQDAIAKGLAAIKKIGAQGAVWI